MSHYDIGCPGHMLITDLPEEVLLQLFSYLSHSDIYFSLRHVCTSWRKISENLSLWESFDPEEEYYTIPTDNNDRVLMSLKDWLTSISPFLSGLTVNSGFHEHIFDVMTDTEVTFPGLKTLDIDYGEFREDEIVSLITIDIIKKMFPNITEICIRSYQILPEFILDTLYTLKKLQNIRFIFRSCECGMHPGDTNQQNQYIQNISKSYSNIIEVDGNSLSNDTVALVHNRFPRLESLSLDCSFKIGFDAFKGMPLKEALLHLCIDQSNINEPCLEIILKNSPNLKYLSMKDCPGINNIGLSYVGKYSKNLETLYIEDNPDVRRKITDIGIEAVASGCIHLTVLVACWLERITDNSLKILSEHCSKLATVQMAGCDVTDLGIKIFAESCRHLRCVDFSECNALTEKGVDHLVKNCIFLHEMNFKKCKFIRDADISYDIKNLKL